MGLRPTIMKFGGTSVEDRDAFVRVARIVGANKASCPVVVVSAISRMTDALIKSVHAASEGDPGGAYRELVEHFARHATVARELAPGEELKRFELKLDEARHEVEDLLRQVAARTMPNAVLHDVIVSYGERLSSSLLAAVLRAHDLPARHVDARRCIVTNDEYGRAAPLMEETATQTCAQIHPLLEESSIPVLGGFIAASQEGATTTLGRGGSDYSASIIGAVLEAREIQIWTDVSGVLTADPRVVKTARPVARLSYDEAAELAYFGAKVLHPKTIQPAVEQRIPVRICNSRAPEEPCTLVCAESAATARTVKAIAHKTNVTSVHVTSARMLGAYGFLRAIFEVFERNRTVVDVVTTSEVSVSLTLDDASALPSIVKELREFGTVKVEHGRAVVCVVGEGLRSTPGIAGRVFNTIKDINVLLISQGASSINLTFVVEESCVRETVARLHEAFFEGAGDAAEA